MVLDTFKILQRMKALNFYHLRYAYAYHLKGIHNCKLYTCTSLILSFSPINFVFYLINYLARPPPTYTPTYLLYKYVKYLTNLITLLACCSLLAYTVLYLLTQFNRTEHYLQCCLALPYLTLLFSTLPYLTLPYLTLPYLTLPYPTLPYLTLPYLTLPYLTLPYLTLPYLTLTYLKGHSHSRSRTNHSQITHSMGKCACASRNWSNIRDVGGRNYWRITHEHAWTANGSAMNMILARFMWWGVSGRTWTCAVSNQLRRIGTDGRRLTAHSRALATH